MMNERPRNIPAIKGNMTAIRRSIKKNIKVKQLKQMILIIRFTIWQISQNRNILLLLVITANVRTMQLKRYMIDTRKTKMRMRLKLLASQLMLLSIKLLCS